VKWRRPSDAERREHQETLELLGKLVLTQRGQVAWRVFVLMSVA
jgi:hypothetical protein